MDITLSAITGLFLRFALRDSGQLAPVFLGIWEGVCLHYLANETPGSLDPHLAYGLRLILDVFSSSSFISALMTLLWSVLTMLILAATSLAHGHDIRKDRRRKRGLSLVRSQSDRARKDAKIQPEPGTLHSRVQLISPDSYTETQSPAAPSHADYLRPSNPILSPLSLIHI